MENSLHVVHSQVFGHGYGYGGSIIEEEEENVVFKHMVVCKTEVIANVWESKNKFSLVVIALSQLMIKSNFPSS